MIIEMAIFNRSENTKNPKEKYKEVKIRALVPYDLIIDYENFEYNFFNSKAKADVTSFFNNPENYNYRILLNTTEWTTSKGYSKFIIDSVKESSDEVVEKIMLENYGFKLK